MQTEWIISNSVSTFEKLFLVGDIGGTNTNIALVGKQKKQFKVIVEFIFDSQQIDNLIAPLKQALQAIEERSSTLKPTVCCICGAGPVKENYCTLTNLNWDIDGKKIEASLGIKTLVINDFLAISYGLPLLDIDDPKQITQIPQRDHGKPRPQGNLRAVIGAGTGLGVGFIMEHMGSYIAAPSEGGHSGFSAFDDETLSLKKHVASKVHCTPGNEPFLSGQGLINIFHYFKEEKGIPITGELEEIDRSPDNKKPELISKYAETNALCREMFDLFVKIFGKISGDIAAMFMSTAGLYLAGGIITKNERYFLENDNFIRFFEQNYKPNIHNLLKNIPIYIIKDYSISLYGAANAAHCLMNESENKE